MATDVKERMEALKEIVDSWSQDPDRIRDYLRWTSQFHSYSPFNLMLIMAQRPTVTRVASYNRWKEAGRQVRKGERGLDIFVPRFGKRVEEDPETGEEKERRFTYFRIGKVFDISQTDGDELPEVSPLAAGTDEAFAALGERLMALVESQGLTVAEVAMDPSSFGHLVRATRTITLNSALSPRTRTLTLIHELAHWFDPALDEEGYYLKNRAECEWVADAAAWAFAESAGIDATAATADYLSGYKGETRFSEVLGRVAKIVSTMGDLALEPRDSGADEEPAKREAVAA